MFDEVRWEDWSEDHIARHGVSPDEVEEVLSTRPRYITKGRNETYLVYGCTSSGRYLLVIAADDGDRVASLLLPAI